VVCDHCASPWIVRALLMVAAIPCSVLFVLSMVIDVDTPRPRSSECRADVGSRPLAIGSTTDWLRWPGLHLNEY